MASPTTAIFVLLSLAAFWTTDVDPERSSDGGPTPWAAFGYDSGICYGWIATRAGFEV